jgi:hypothetical protein
MQKSKVTHAQMLGDAVIASKLLFINGCGYLINVLTFQGLADTSTCAKLRYPLPRLHTEAVNMITSHKCIVHKQQSKAHYLI